MHDNIKELLSHINSDLTANNLIVGDTVISKVYREYDRKPNNEHIVMLVAFDNYYDRTQKAFKANTTIHFDFYCTNEIKSVRVRDAFIDRFQLKYNLTQLRHNLGVAELDNGKFVCRATGKYFNASC